MEVFKISKIEVLNTEYEVRADCLEDAFDQVRKGEAEEKATSQNSCLTILDDYEIRVRIEEAKKRNEMRKALFEKRFPPLRQDDCVVQDQECEKNAEK